MPEPISYTLRFSAPQTHYVDVEALVPTGGRPAVELMMAAWTPGSYMIREFSRNLEDVSATGETNEAGEPLSIDKTSKNRWTVETRGLPRVRIQYRVYSREMSVRTNFVDQGFAILNGAPTFLTLADGERRPHDVQVILPAGWKVAVSPLAEPVENGGELRVRADDFDTLVDSPLYAGNARLYRFEVAGRPHLLVNEGEGDIWDGPRSAADAERIVREQVALWGVAPYPRYVIFNLITEAGGGLEHKDSTVLMTSRWKARTREGYVDWLELVSHEFFHAWNVKRLRPVALGPFDYEQEVYTRDLWVAEGLTTYYGDLLVHRAGLSTRKEYLKHLSQLIEELQTTPGRQVQSLADSSFDAWIKYYRKDENSLNTGISYYTKGAVAGFLLDAKIRHATRGRASLDDVMRRAWQRFSGDHGFASAEFRAAAEEVAGIDLDPWFDQVLEGTGELDYAEALAWLGLRFTEKEKDKENGDTSKEPAGWLGIDTEVQGGRLVVTQLRRDTPGYTAGLNFGDEILALDDYRIPPEGWKDRLKAYRPGQKATLLIARRERILLLPVTFGEEPRLKWKLEPDPAATTEQKAHLEAWTRSAGPVPAVVAGARGHCLVKAPATT
jgi:predicted metalloprotease with PDZ domain